LKSSKKKALFVNFEGIDNAGKSTLISDIEREFRKHIPVHVTNELTTDVGAMILQKLKDSSLDIFEKVLLFAADRQQRYLRDMKRKLNTRCLFLSDRWFYSAIAYRCAEDPSIKSYVEEVNRIFIIPDVTFYIDITAAESVKRGQIADKTHYTQSFLNKVRREYLNLTSRYNFIVIDGQRRYELVKNDVFMEIEDLLKRSGVYFKDPNNQGF